MAKRAFLIHGWEGYPEESWRPWLRDMLKEKGFTVINPAMPDTDHPKMNEWLEFLIKTVSNPNKDCYFVGHSLGCITILRYLETLEEGQEIGGAVLVAGFCDNLGYEEINSFFEKPIDWDKINSHCKKFIAINSDNDPYVPLKHADIFKEKLGAEVLIKHNMKHFSVDDGINELAVALEAVLKISK
ncbi:MAG: serine hydrolase family protein [Candidatus Aenigmatarchaeota archaeon]|nr:MAG: serine hydrolase family protein [Candidatus Aenigmarchaeota archaeon]